MDNKLSSPNIVSKLSFIYLSVSNFIKCYPLDKSVAIIYISYENALKIRQETIGFLF